VELLKVRDLLEKSKKEIVDSKGIKAYFLMDDSGIFQCSGIELVYEAQKDVVDDESTLSKLGNTISKLFSKDDGGKDKEKPVTENDTDYDNENDNVKDAENAPNDQETEQKDNESEKKRKYN